MDALPVLGMCLTCPVAIVPQEEDGMMNRRIRILHTGLIVATLFGMITISREGTASGQSYSAAETVRSVGRMLERLPYYGVFDYIAFGVDRGTVTLVGYSYQGNLKKDAEMAAKRASGVDEVANKIELLPASLNDDRIRWATFYRIYTDDFLSRYAPGGVHGVLRDLRDQRLFPGMQPVGFYAIHIIVKNGRTMLEGVVDSAADRQIAEVRAREVSGVFGVENDLIVAGTGERTGSK
jgi:hyperosmotically inducible periplasmic protein